MQPGTYPKNTYFDAEASRRAAERIVRENQEAARRFAVTGQVQTSDVAIAALDAADRFACWGGLRHGRS